VAREYDEKYQASLEEIDQYKLQLEKSLKEQEQRQANMFTRQLADKDKIIS
jgi:hypothetical protein